MMAVQLRWQTKTTPATLRPMLKTLGEAYPIAQGKGEGIDVIFSNDTEPGLCEIRLDGSTANVRYDLPAQAARAVGALLSGLPTTKDLYRETTPFRLLGIMLDCSRNAVMTVDHLKTWMRRMALLGYNMLMLYTEDTYQLPGEPYFGYQRGAYSEKELKAVVSFAAKLNIEVIPCIQTLGHLERILRHGTYRHIRDTSSVVLVGEAKTYELIDKMIAQWRSVCSTNRIHIGMDETHDLGRGQYLDRHGFRRGFDLFNEHLTHVVEICKKHDFQPMIWSDMYFRLGCKSGDYYDPTTVIPQEVLDNIPPETELVYWDYYHDNKEFYLDWIERHRKMGKEPAVGSGIWTWDRYWYDKRITEATAGPCIDACLEAGVKEVFFTEWGDNGAYCDYDSAFAGKVFCAEKSYGAQTPSELVLEKRFAGVCGGSYAAHLMGSEIHGGVEGFYPVLWDDPLFETHFRTACGDNPKRMAELAKGFATLARKLKKHDEDRQAGDLRHASILANAFAERYSLSAALLAAYRKKDKNALRLVQKKIPKVVEAVRAFDESFRNSWLRRNKPEGMETTQARLGMLEARYREMSRRLLEYVRGDVSTIAELDCACPPKG